MLPPLSFVHGFWRSQVKLVWQASYSPSHLPIPGHCSFAILLCRNKCNQCQQPSLPRHGIIHHAGILASQLLGGFIHLDSFPFAMFSPVSLSSLFPHVSVCGMCACGHTCLRKPKASLSLFSVVLRLTQRGRVSR